MFGLRVLQEEIFQFYLRITLTFKWAYYKIGIYFCEINYIFQLPKDCFSTYKLRYFERSPSGVILKLNDIIEKY